MKPTTLKIFGCLMFVAVTALVFQGCGGGGGGGGGGGVSSILSGLAVSGAPIIGTVTIKDSSAPTPLTKYVIIEADGSYSISVAGMTAPFMLRADGTVGGNSVSLYSAATAADVNGNINVTPLTDLIMANIAGTLAVNYFTSGNFSTLTTADLNTAADDLKAKILPVLTAIGVSNSIDLLRASFTADHTGMDAALDVLRVEVDPITAIATITNIINMTSITDDVANPNDVATIDATGTSAGLSEFQLMVDKFEAFGTLFATSLPASNNATLVALFDATFLMDGTNRAQFLSEITSDDTMIGIQFTNLSLIPDSLTATTAEINFSVIQGGVPQDTMIFNMLKTGGIWKITGNGLIARAKVSSFARKQDIFISSVFTPNYIDTGLQVNISDDANVGIDYAIVTGPGLPVGGALYFNEGDGNSFNNAADGAAYVGIGTSPYLSYGHGQRPMLDVDIDDIDDNSVYTIELWEDNGTPSDMVGDVLLASYTSKLGKRPYLNSALSVSSFATITAPTQLALWNFGNIGGTKIFTWTIPTGLMSSNIHYFRSGTGGFDTGEKNLTATATSGGITMLAPVQPAFGTLQASGVNLVMKDSFGRELTTIYNGDD